MKKFLMVALLVLAPALASAGEKVFFDTDRSELSAAELQKVSALAQDVQKTGAKVVIIGNADKRGSRLYNLDLGMRRATAVVKALAGQGVPDDQISISLSYGEEKPLAPADGVREHLAANRRVDIVLVEARVVTKTVVQRYPVDVVRLVPSYRRNRVSLFGGAGPMGLSKNVLGAQHYTVGQDYVPAAGLGYSRSINDRLNIGLAAFTNNSYFINFGFDF